MPAKPYILGVAAGLGAGMVVAGAAYARNVADAPKPPDA